MGWTSYHVSGKIDRRAECRKAIGVGFTVLKDALVGNTYYAAIEKDQDIEQIMRGEPSLVFGLVIKTSVDNNDYFNFSYKLIEDNMGPCEDNCPQSILDLLTPTDNTFANEWRERCYKNIEKRRSSRGFNNLPVGTEVDYTDSTGNVHRLVKHEPAFQFSTWFWYDEDNNGYIKKSNVNADNTVIVA